MSTLVDAGPLVAILDSGEAAHARCRDALPGLSLPLVTTWPAFTEAMYLLNRAGGWPAQRALWALTESGRLLVEDLSAAARARSAQLMASYADTPMDLADATLVALAEESRQRKIFTLDSDFTVYRLDGRHPFDVVPG